MLNGLLLVALALQYGTQPYLTSRFISSLAVDSRAVVLVTELLKASLCAFPVLLRATPAGLAGSAASAPARTRRSVLSSLRRASLPAVCYLLQNLALQAAYRDLDSLTFNCLNQTKVVATAVTLFLLTRQGQSPQQCLALLLVVCAGILLQLAGEAQRRETSGSEGVAAFRRGVVVRSLALSCSHCGRASRILPDVPVCLCPLRPRLLALASHSAGKLPVAHTLGVGSRRSQGKSSSELTLEMESGIARCSPPSLTVRAQAFLTVPVIAVNFVWSEGSVQQALVRSGRIHWLT